VKKRCIRGALRDKNEDLALWLLTTPNVWGINDRYILDYTLLLYLAQELEKDSIETLLSLRKADGQPIVTAEVLNYEICPGNLDTDIKYTALERVLHNFSYWGLANLLRRHGATNFGSLDPELKKQFLANEQALSQEDVDSDFESDFESEDSRESKTPEIVEDSRNKIDDSENDADWRVVTKKP